MAVMVPSVATKAGICTYKVMEVLAENGGSVSFALPDNRVHAVMSIVPEGTGVLLQLMMLGEGHIIEGEAHRAENMEDNKYDPFAIYFIVLALSLYTLFVFPV